MDLYSTFELPDGTAAVWWRYLQIAPGSKQGVYYQNDSTATGQQISIEWLMTDDKGLGYQFIATYNAGLKGQLSVYYFTAGDTGTNSTIGIVGSDPNGSKCL